MRKKTPNPVSARAATNIHSVDATAVATDARDRIRSPISIAGRLPARSDTTPLSIPPSVMPRKYHHVMLAIALLPACPIKSPDLSMATTR